ncbi:MAG: bifunctional 5,10-methylenetetrahydrofolate dehydrogenase/5,10-methenyltetrahydrofolate cyclohydrolase [Candidatus Liptonbacteria bacterium]|nr:bifunctional 5,10-methylenetetrahydrofolate dehydrogenase/5,10-methenyltetrahydrofolate cyclohydrolase [Candidatus Liptonbacteria bacterium]
MIDGKKIAAELLGRLKEKPKPKKFFAGVLIGDDPASESFQKLKQDTAKGLGIDYRIYKLAPALGNDALREKVGKLAAGKTCGGVIVQLPLPEPLNATYIVNAIPPEKDPDCLSERTLGAHYNNRAKVLHPAVATVEEVLRRAKVDLKGKRVAVIGAGMLIGKPIAVWLMRKVSELYVLGRGADFAILKNCDVVISGAGKAGLFNAETLKEGALVVDFGYDSVGGKLLGDFDSSSLATRHSSLATISYTPTPGGTGPILVAKLFENFYKLNEKSLVNNTPQLSLSGLTR